jgi:predicted MFS family arabinose efflux permease
MSGSLNALNALNFFMADVRDGLGPFLGVFLQERGWSPSEIGMVMTIGGLAGMAAAAPLGAFVDSTKAKRGMLVASAIAIIVASMAILAIPTFAATAASQIATGIAAAAVGPAIAGLTLGLVHQRGFARQLGRNEAFNHAGNVVAAFLGGTLSYALGLQAIFWLMVAMALGSIAAVLRIAPADIDHRAARGLGQDGGDETPSWRLLLTSRPLIVLSLTLALFHLGNAAMLPLLGQALVARGATQAGAYTAATIVIAQFTMIAMALAASRLALRRGYWIVFVLALIALPLRGALAASALGEWVLVPVQILDGVGAGLLGVAVPGLVARILAGTGHVNAGLGAAMTMQGIGAALSTTVAGIVAERFGYPAAFLTLGAIAALALLLWLVATPLVLAACRGSENPYMAPQQA